MKKRILLQILVILVPGLASCTFSSLSPKTPVGRSTEAIEEKTEPTSPDIPFGISIYVVGETDGLIGVANKFDIEPETILFSNFEILQDNPLNFKPGIELYIPVVDGAVYRWKEGDRILKVAARFHVKPEFITMWAGNQLDYVAFSRGEQIEIKPGTIIFIPTGRRFMEPINAPTISP
ncbi:MAG: hypothetical protein ACNA8H_06240 [Anaerolineales bacterium]